MTTPRRHNKRDHDRRRVDAKVVCCVCLGAIVLHFTIPTRHIAAPYCYLSQDGRARRAMLVCDKSIISIGSRALSPSLRAPFSHWRMVWIMFNPRLCPSFKNPRRSRWAPLQSGKAIKQLHLLGQHDRKAGECSPRVPGRARLYEHHYRTLFLFRSHIHGGG